MLHTRLTTLFLLCLLTAMLHGQTGRFYSTDKELSNSLINKVYQDKKGFIWIATEDGLNKFDGNKFTIYRKSPNKEDGLLNNYVKTVFEDSQDRFWVVCINGVQLYDRSTDSFHTLSIYNKGRKTSSQMASNILERYNKEIWIGTYGQGIVTLNGDRFLPQKELNKLTQSYFIHFLYEDTQRRIWIATEDKGLFCYYPYSKHVQHFTAPSEITSKDVSFFCEDKDKTLFVSTLNGGLMKLGKGATHFKPIPYKGKNALIIKTLMVDRENNVFIGTEGKGVKMYDRQSETIIDHNIHSSVFDVTMSKVHSILEDKAGNLWLGIFQKGLLCIPGIQNKFNYYGYKSYLKSSIGSSCVMAIHADRNGVAWIGTDNDGLYAIDDNGNQLAHYKEENGNGQAPSNIMCIFEDSEHKLWVGSYFSGLAQVNKKNGVCTYVNELSNKGKNGNNEKIYCLVEDRNKSIWVCTYGSGIYRMSLSGQILEQYQSDKVRSEDWNLNRLCNDWVNCMIEDRDGLLWIGTCNGLGCFHPQKKTFINFFHKNNLLPNVFVHSLMQDHKGLIWIGTSEGLYRFDKQEKKFKKYTTIQGLPSDVICGMKEDKQGNFWISTHRGISRLNVQTESFTNYYASDGIQGNEFTRGASSQNNQGKIFFGGTAGVTSFFPEHITGHKKKLNIEITDFLVANQAVKKGDRSGNILITDTLVMDAKRFTLCHRDNTFSLEFSTMEYTNPDRIVYQYRMQGTGTDWMSTQPGVNRVTYNSLAPGKYLFQVRAKDDNNSSNIRSVEIVISPPWYETGWAYCIWLLIFYVVIYLLVMYILSRIRHKRELSDRQHQEELNEAKLQFFINISHEIRTPMTLILSPLEKLLAEKSDKESTYRMMYRNAQRILRLINQLLDIRRIDKGQMHLRLRETDIVGFIDDLMQTFQYQAEKKKIDFRFAHAQEMLKVWIDLNNFDKVLLNVLSNAFKYTPEGGRICVELSTGTQPDAPIPLKEFFQITVTDSGIGINKEELTQIFERFYQINNDVTKSNFGTGIGLHLSRSLVELHHGRIFAENNSEGCGTRFVIQLPMGCKHLQPNELEENAETIITEKRTTPQTALLSLDEEEGEKSNGKEEIKARTKYRLLIVEDEEEIRHYMRQELCTDFHIEECENGKEALEHILCRKPDLVISDVMMPEMDGITLCKRIKQNANTSHIPIILLTAKSKIEDRMEGLETGADGYIVKPFNTELLRSTIENLISNRKRIRNQMISEKQVDEQLMELNIPSADEQLMGRVMRTINEQLANPDFSVEILAREVGLSRVHIYRKLKELTNLSASTFIRNVRLKQAAQLLRERGLSVSETAYATGFTTPSHFSNAFKDFYGISPSEYAAGK